MGDLAQQIRDLIISSYPDHNPVIVEDVLTEVEKNGETHIMRGDTEAEAIGLHWAHPEFGKTKPLTEFKQGTVVKIGCRTVKIR